jgi:parallel beta-helix repeat protein
MGGTGVTVKGGTVAGFFRGIVLDGGSYNSINHMTVQGNGTGIYVLGAESRNHDIVHNTVIGNASGISLGPTSNTTVAKNTVTGNVEGIELSAGAIHNVIELNVVDSDSTGIRVRAGDPINIFTNIGPTFFDVISPSLTAYVEDTDYQVMSGSGSGNVTARLVPINIALAPTATILTNSNAPNTSTSGCQGADYDAAGFQQGDVALLQRGTCTFDIKILNALNHGASAVVLFNEGQLPERVTLSFGVLGSVGNSIPVLSTTYGVGFELYELTRAGPVTVQIITKTDNVLQIPPGATGNVLKGNTGVGNSNLDGVDKNFAPSCDDNVWVFNFFGTVNQRCVDPDATVQDDKEQGELGAVSHDF